MEGILCREHDRKKAYKNDIIRFPVNIADIIEEILCDPRIDDKMFENWCDIIEKSGYTGKMTKSDLYSFTEYICYDDYKH